MIHIEPVTVEEKDSIGITVRALRWRWSCDCHDWASPPWPERPSEETAAAEREVLFGERQARRVGTWGR